MPTARGHSNVIGRYTGKHTTHRGAALKAGARLMQSLNLKQIDLVVRETTQNSKKRYKGFRVKFETYKGKTKLETKEITNSKTGETVEFTYPAKTVTRVINKNDEDEIILSYIQALKDAKVSSEFTDYVKQYVSVRSSTAVESVKKPPKSPVKKKMKKSEAVKAPPKSPSKAPPKAVPKKGRPKKLKRGRPKSALRLKNEDYYKAAYPGGKNLKAFLKRHMKKGKDGTEDDPSFTEPPPKKTPKKKTPAKTPKKSANSKPKKSVAFKSNPVEELVAQLEKAAAPTIAKSRKSKTLKTPRKPEMDKFLNKVHAKLKKTPKPKTKTSNYNTRSTKAGPTLRSAVKKNLMQGLP